MPNRSIIIGDVHGCARELQSLLLEVNPGADDEVIFVGDLINKGPESQKVVQIARELGARSTLGNHEQRILRYRKTGDTRHLKPGDTRTMASLTPADWTYLQKMPLTIELPAYEALVAHGGFVPGIPWREQGPEVVVHVQVIDAQGRPAKRSQAPKGRPWAEFWNGPEFVIYGHTPRRQILRHPHSIGLDTGCVHGGHLSALVLPERRLVQVKAIRSHTRKTLNAGH